MDRSHSPELRAAIARLYAGALADFVQARDALAKKLRSAGDRDSAAAVKALGKPSRSAWVLNRVAQTSPHADALRGALNDLVNAHAGSGDARSAMSELRSAVRGFAVAAVAEARAAGFNLEAADLSTALMAVVADPTAFNELQGGYLAEVPEAGSLDLLALLPVRPKLEVFTPERPSEPGPDPATIAALREEAQRAAGILDAARKTAEAATAVLTGAESARAAASERLRAAQADLEAAEQRLRFAQREKDAAEAELKRADTSYREVSTRLSRLG